MSFRIRGLDPAPFLPLFALGDAELEERGARRMVADSKPGFPCRVTLEDAEPGERLILVNYEHQPADTPYRASHAIFVRESAREAYDRVGEVPPVLRPRLLSLRAFDLDHMMVDAGVVEGREVEGLIERLFGRPDTAYVHAHNAGRGCFAARIDRA